MPQINLCNRTIQQIIDYEYAINSMARDYYAYITIRQGWVKARKTKSRPRPARRQLLRLFVRTGPPANNLEDQTNDADQYDVEDREPRVGI